ncbi:hypothetical protein PIB30_071406 [Stylosanthes scabra]|uniref:PB1-like domain-containing protein n=1 Tax=Stylosanthes scabra TaxID=79078 RepID=A0ABU6WQE7_9FABA|nr:hypothetical protein [Stylosanthes scabra]
MPMGLLSTLEVSDFYWAEDDLGRGLKLIRFDSELVRMLDHAKRNGGSVHVFCEHVVDAPIEVDVVNVEDDDFSQHPATEPQQQPQVTPKRRIKMRARRILNPKPTASKTSTKHKRK